MAVSLLSYLVGCSEKNKCDFQGEISNIKFIKFYKWDGLRPNKIEFTFHLKPRGTSDSLPLIPNTGNSLTDVQESCFTLTINDTIVKNLYLLREKETFRVLKEKERKEFTFYLDFGSLYGMSLQEMKGSLPELKSLSLSNTCLNKCITINPEFPPFEFYLDGEKVKQGDEKLMTKSNRVKLPQDI